tara:strand:- start:62 stop:457 length:396 start_codon:yes stop_codon:yes gene_type:complete
MDNINFNKKIIKGKELIEMGKHFDDNQKEIDPNKDYQVKIDIFKNKISIIAIDDINNEIFKEYIEKIQEEGGYLNFAINYKDLGVIDSFSDLFLEAESVIEFFGEKEDFEKAIYMRDELKKLKEYYYKNKN